ncbi:MAG TPA: PQQ-binding-like beta-propeller repeat protein [Planctomycetota bacterium]|nr:PQQ-binding-like beta-propeller repeat protein [Planctomycetota bacterium]
MTKRLVCVALVAATMACKSSTTSKPRDDEGRAPAGNEATGSIGHDAVQTALMGMGIDGRTLRIDFNQNRKGEQLRFGQVHLTNDLLLLETEAKKPRLYAFQRGSLNSLWASDLLEPTGFPVASNGDVVVLLSQHYAHCLETFTGRGALQFMSGSLEGVTMPPRELPFTPTGGAAVGNDTFYVPSLGSPRNNKTIESFSLITGQVGWGYRSASDILTTPLVGGPSTDPKLYFVTRTGLVTCMDATNYGFPPRGPRWEQLLEAGVEQDFFVTEDTASDPGSVFVVDREGVVYCLNRITGARRWTHATARVARGGPKVFGPVCVVPMKQGLCAFDTVNVIYSLKVTGGPDDGKTRWVRSGQPATIQGVTFKLEGEVLTASGGSFRVNRNMPVERAPLYNGSQVLVGSTVVDVADHGSQPLWIDKDYDSIVARIGEKLIAKKGDKLVALDMWTGEPAGDMVSIAGVRLIPVNTGSANLYLVGGNAIVYGFYPR